MKVILLKNVPRLGQQYDVVEVSSGYANNFLFPQKLAESATEKKIAELDTRREKLKAQEDAHQAELQEKLETLEEQDLTITMKADDHGNLYKKLQASDIAEALKEELSIDLPDRTIMLDSPITEVGEHEVAIEALNQKATLTVTVIKE
jgi:large subunit ribosomal protein L9